MSQNPIFRLFLYFGLTYITFALIYIIPSTNSKIPDLTTNTLAGQPHVHDEDGSEAHSSRILSITADLNHPQGQSSRTKRDTSSFNSRAGEEDGNTEANTISSGCSSSSGERSCCLQYTWPGNEKTQNAPPEVSTSNITRNCTDVKLENPAAACFNPIVYAYSNSTRRPDPQKVKEYCIDNSEACFCAGMTCIKYSILNNDAEETIINETHFCGTLTQTNNNELLNSGCYKESRDGRIFEVCVCKGDYCNHGQSGLFASVGIKILLSWSGFLAMIQHLLL